MSKHLLDKANEKYKELYNTGKMRYKNLPNHHRSHSNWLEKENRGELNPYYNSYDRGAIVFVEFGVNIGHELSGGHFAIVLNDNDNKRNSILNVIPVSSKNKKYYHPIDKTVFQNASRILEHRFEDFTKEYEKNLEKRDKLEKEFETLNDEVTKGLDSYPTLDNNDRRDSLDYLKAKVSIMKKQIEEIKRTESKNKKEKDQIESIYLRYSKFDKKTYACYQSIQTISKLKIRRINKYDPSGSMRIDNSTLKELDRKIVEYYTNFSIDERYNLTYS